MVINWWETSGVDAAAMANGNGNADGNENGIDSGETVVSSIRAGMKREFAMMIKAHAEPGFVLGKRRVTRSQISPLISKGGGNIVKDKIREEKKREKKIKYAEEVKKVELVVLDEEESKSDVLNEEENVGSVIGEFGIVESNLKVDSSSSAAELVGTGAAVKMAAKNVAARAPIITYFRRRKSAFKPKVEDLEPKVEVLEPKVVVLEKEVEALDTKVVAQEVVVALEVVEPPAEKPIKKENVLPIPSKLDTKVSLKTPTYLKELLQTGFLEGASVRYIRGSRGNKSGGTSLRGVIKGYGVLCFCEDCKGSQVVTPNQFELHAGSGNKRPPEYMYLENGKSLRDILNVCKEAPVEVLEFAIRNAIGQSQAGSAVCMSCEAFIGQAAPGGSLLCASCIALRVSEYRTTESTDTNSRPSASKISSNSRPRNKSQGKLTKKDLGLHKLVFESPYLADGTPLGYYTNGKLLQSGHKAGSGILCYCCNQVVSPSQFEAHAGCASRRKPYLQIYTPEGISLHEWSLAIKKNMKLSTDDSDDVCSICQGMGELLCCDMCPRAFHIECVNLPSIPVDNWYCRYCSNMMEKEKFVEHNANAVAAGRVAGVDPVEEVKKRCVRTIGAKEPEDGGCALCRGHDFNSKDFGPLTVIICDQCEKEYHVGCLKEHGMEELKELPEGKWFCSAECFSINSVLQKLVDDGDKELPDFLVSLIKQKHEDLGTEDKISWRLLQGKMASKESKASEESTVLEESTALEESTSSEEIRKWLSGAVSVFHDRFDPIGDTNKGRDLIPVLVYGRSIRDIDYSGMYTAVLTVNSLVVSAGLFRVFGQSVAEIPLVATSNDFQGKGYFQSLFYCIENLLSSLNVNDIVLPAAPEAECIWKKKFGFQKISTMQLKEYKRYHQMMIFQGTTVWHKRVARSGTSNS